MVWMRGTDGWHGVPSLSFHCLWNPSSLQGLQETLLFQVLHFQRVYLSRFNPKSWFIIDTKGEFIHINSKSCECFSESLFVVKVWNQLFYCIIQIFFRKFFLFFAFFLSFLFFYRFLFQFIVALLVFSEYWVLWDTFTSLSPSTFNFFLGGIRAGG